MKVLRQFGRLLEAVETLASAIAELTRAQHAARPAEARLAELEELVVKLELDRSKWEAEIDGVLLKAEGKLQAANNAEARTRTMKKSYEHLVDPRDPDSEELEEALPRGYAPAGAEEQLSPMPMVLASNKANALMSKFSRF